MRKGKFGRKVVALLLSAVLGLQTVSVNAAYTGKQNIRYVPNQDKVEQKSDLNNQITKESEDGSADERPTDAIDDDNTYIGSNSDANETEHEVKDSSGDLQSEESQVSSGVETETEQKLPETEVVTDEKENKIVTEDEETEVSKAGNAQQFIYTQEDGIATITGYTGADIRIIIPSAIDGYAVQKIGDGAFRDNSAVTEITFPDSVTEIDDEAFYNNTSLNKVVLSKGLTYMGTAAFGGCTSLNSIMIPKSLERTADAYDYTGPFEGSGLKTAEFEEGTVRIAKSLFRNCEMLESIEIPEGVKTIDESAFAYCKGLKKVSIPNGVDSIESYAFEECGALTEISLPDSIATIEKGAFRNAKSLSKVVLSKGLTYMGTAAFGGCTSLNSIMIPKSLERTADSYDYTGPFGGSGLKTAEFEEGTVQIAKSLFRNCEMLESIEIPEGVKTIDESAFAYCKGLKKVSIPNGVDSIESYAFEECGVLTEISLPDSIVTIEKEAFRNARSLSKVVLPKGLTYMGTAAFGGCTSLNSIMIPKSLERTADAYDYTGPFGESGLKTAKFEEGTVRIAKSLFRNCEMLESIEIPEGVKTIDESAFAYCKGLKKVSIPNGVESIESYAFEECGVLTEISLPDSIVTIEKEAFRNAKSLSKVVLSKGLTYMGTAAFGGCTDLSSIMIPKSLERTADFYDYTGPFGGSGLKTVDFEKGTVRIAKSLFRNCEMLESIEIPEGVKTIDESAFAYCKGLKKVSIPEGVESIGAYAFRSCEELRSIVIPKGVTSISDEAFSYCTRLRIRIPDTVVQIAENVFNKSSDLTVYASKYSNAAVCAIDHNTILQLTGDTDYPENGILNYRESYYQAMTQTSSNYVEYEAVYSADIAGVSDMAVHIKLPFTMNVVKGTVKIDGKSVEDYEYDASTHLFKIPVSEKKGKITFSANISQNGDNLSYAVLDYRKNGKRLKDTIDVISAEHKDLTVYAGNTVATSQIDVHGVAGSRQKVTISVEDGESIEVTAKADGNYAGTLQISNPVNYRTYQLEAVVTSADGHEITANTNVQYKEDAVKVTEFKLYYNNHNDTEIDLLNTFSHNSVTQFNPAYQFVFNIKFSNSSKLKEVNVVSTRNGLQKRLPAVWNESTESFIANGWFDEENHNYVPGKLSVEYFEEKASVTMEDDFEYDNSELEGGIAKLLPYSTVTEIDASQLEDAAGNDDEYVPSSQVAYRIELDKALDDTTLGGNAVVTALTEIYKQGTEIKDVMKGYEVIGSYVTGDEETKEVYLASKGHSLEKLAVFIHDWTSNEVIKQLIEFKKETTVGSTVKIDDLLTTMNSVSKITGIISDHYEITSDYEETELKIDELSVDTATRQKLHKQNEALMNDRLKYVAVMAIIGILMGSATVATGGATMTVAPAIMEGMLAIMGSLSAFFFTYRMDGIVSGDTEAMLRWAIDPSGYVYEGITDNRLEGVKATLYYRADQNSQVVLWDASEYSQSNPLYTDSEGNYAWDVPEGQWQVKYEKEGYETACSNWLDVPPPQTTVNIGMVSKTRPVIEWTKATNAYIEVSFNQYMKASTLKADKFVLKDADGKVMEYDLVVPETYKAPDGTVLAKGILLYSKQTMEQGKNYQVQMQDGIENYAGKTTVSQYINTNAEKQVSLSCETGTVYIVAGKFKNVNINVVDEAGRCSVLKCISDSGTIQVPEEIAVQNGAACLNIKTSCIGEGVIQISVPNTSVVLKLRIKIVLDESGQEESKPVESESIEDILKIPVLETRLQSQTSTVVLSWSEVSGATQYEIYRSQDEGRNYKKIGVVKTKNYSDQSIETGRSYCYKVRGLYEGGEYTEYSNAVKIGMPGSEIKIPDPVMNLKAQPAGKNRTKLIWSKSKGAEGYLVYAQKNGKYGYCGMTTNMAGTVSYTDTKALDSDYNFYWVFPYVKDDNGKMHPGGCIKYVFAKGVTLAVTNLKAASQTGGVGLTWSASAGAEGYLVYGKTATGKYGYIGMTTKGTSYTDKRASKKEFNFYWVFPYHKDSTGKMIVGGTPKYVYGKAK